MRRKTEIERRLKRLEREMTPTLSDMHYYSLGGIEKEMKTIIQDNIVGGV